MSFIALDLGTSFIKGAVVDAEDIRIEHIRRVPFPQPIAGLPAGRRELSPAAVMSAVHTLLDELLPLAGQPEGLVMCSQMHGLVFVTERGEARSNITTWQDERVLQPHPSGAGSYWDVMRQRVSPAQIADVGREFRVGYPAGILFWLAERGEWPAGDLIPSSLPDFVLANLCQSTAGIELTMAMAHGALNQRTMSWHRELIASLGLDGVRWPEIRRQGAVVGEMRIGSALVPCYTPVGDFQCALAGALIQADELSLNISTGSQVTRLSPQLALGEYQTRPFFDGATLNTITHIPAGRPLSALVALLTELARTQDVTLADPWSYIIQQAEQAGDSELRVDMAFFQSSCGDRGSIRQIQERDLNVGSIFRAAFRNMADNYYAKARMLSPEETWERLVFSGGLAQRIPQLRAFIIDMFQRPYRICPSTEDTLLGLLILARVWTGRAAGVLPAGREILLAHEEGRLALP